MRRIILSMVVLTVYICSFGQINKQNGTAVQSIPLFNFNDTKAGLGLNISLHYSSGGGVMANEQSSAVGLKWGLNAGGVIERETRGIPDDQYCNYQPNINAAYLIVKRDFEEIFNNYYPNGYLYTSVSPDDKPKELAIQPRFRESQTKDYKQSVHSSEDREADIFRFSLNGRTGSFIIGKNKAPVTLDYSGLKISFEELNTYAADKIRTKIRAFTIVDENGLIYRFDAVGRNKVTKGSSESQQLSADASVNRNTNYSIDEFVINSWSLSSITNPFTNEAINFLYDEVYAESVVGYEPASQVSVSNDPYSVNRIEHTVMSCSNTKSFQYKKQIREITLPGNRKVNFYYLNDVVREDAPAEPPLKRIESKYLETTIGFAEFSYKYFFKKQLLPLTGTVTDPSEKRYLRLALCGVKTGGTNEKSFPETQLEYYTGAEETDSKALVPPRFTFASDNWGYYNASDYITETGNIEDFSYYGANRWNLSNFQVMVMDKENPDILSNGGFTVNTDILKLKDIKQNYAKFGLLRKVKSPEGGTLEYIYEQNKMPDRYVGGMRVSKIIADDGNGNQYTTNLKYGYRNCTDCAEPEESGWGYESPKFTLLMNTVYNKTSDVVGATWAVESFKKGGKEDATVNSYERNSQLKTLIQSYYQVLKTDAQFFGYPSLGHLYFSATNTTDWEFNADYMQVMNYIFSYLIFNWINDINYKKSISCSFQPINYKNSFGINYSSVTEWQNNGENGYVTQIFTGKNDMSFPAWQTTPYAFPYSNRQRFYGWEVGLPKATEYYDKNWKMVKLEELKYQFKTIQLGDNYKSASWGVAGYYSHRHDWYAYNAEHVQDYMVTGESYTYKVGKPFLEEMKTTIYTQDNNITTQITKYQYNQVNHQVASSSTTDSKGNTIGSNNYYVTDYTTPVAIQVLKDKNMLNTPVSSVSWKQPPGQPKRMVSTSITQYGLIANGEIKPMQLFGNKVQNLPLNNLVNNFDPANLAAYPDIESLGTNFYDADGNLAQTNAPDRNPSSFIYNYDKRLLVAVVENAETGKSAYTSFETNDLGNWQLTGYSPTNAYSITGSQCLKINPGASVTTSVAIGTTYTLSFWMRGSNVSVTASTVLPPKIQGPTVNGWTYMQYEIPANAYPPVITGNCYIDELRLYPKNSSMVTTAYDPARSLKTAVCDINNRIIYYQYDDLGRLIAERNEQYDVIKYYEYKYKNQ